MEEDGITDAGRNRPTSAPRLSSSRLALKRRLIIGALALLLLAGTGFALDRYVLPTRIILVNYPGFTAARIAAAAEGSWVSVEARSLEELDSGSGAALVLVFGRGISLDSRQQAALRKMSGRGTAVFVESPTDPNTDVTSLSGEALDRVRSYLAFGGSANYRNLIAYARAVLDGKRIAAPRATAPVPIPRNVLFARDSESTFETVEAFEVFYRASGGWTVGGRKLALVTSVPGPFNANRDHLDAMIDAFEARGFNVYPVSAATRRLAFLQEIDPDAVLYMPHGALTLDKRDEAVDWLEANGIPLFTPLSVFQRHEDWLKDPQGFSGPLLTMNLVLAEIDGGIAPFAMVAQFPDANGLDIFRAIPRRLDRFVARVECHLALKDKPNAEKKLAIFFLKGPGEGAMSAGNMEVAPSLYRLLTNLREAGYDLGDLPKDAAAFEAMVQAQAPVLAPYARGDMAAWLASNAPAWIETVTYKDWCAGLLGDAMCGRVGAAYGPFPGRYLSRPDGSALAVARLTFGNVAVLPQPLPGIGEDAFRLIHGADTAPPYPYIGAYLWAREGFGADAILHFGTHGSLEFTPGKQVALSDDDWSDALIGDLPHFYVYTINNVGEAIIAKRRSYATILSHLTPPLAEAGLTSDLNALRTAMDGWRRVAGATRAERTAEIRALAERLDLLDALDLPAEGEWNDGVFLKLANFVERQETTRIALGLYTLGAGYTSEEARQTVFQMTAGPLAAALLDLDRLRGRPVASAEAETALFKTRYRVPAEAAVQTVLGGTAPGTVIGCLVTPEERARAETIRKANARPDDGAIIRGFISIADAGEAEMAERTEAFDRQALIEALSTVLADPANRDLVESWRSEQQLQRAIKSLDPAVRVRAETVANVIPIMREALALTAEADMRRLLTLLRNPKARTAFTELLDDPDLAERVAAERSHYLENLLTRAVEPDRLVALEWVADSDAFPARLTNSTPDVLDRLDTTLDFYARSRDLSKAIEGVDLAGDVAALLGRATVIAEEGRAAIAAERRKRQATDRAFLDAVDRVTGLLADLPQRLKALKASGGHEMSQILLALDGGFIAPSPGGDPVVAPASLPTGRNMIAIDAERAPSEAAWRVGEQLADALLARHQARHGRLPKKIAVTLWPGDFIQSEGAMIAQVLHLIGAAPVRDPFGRVTDVRLVPAEQLGRSRVDVVVQTAGQLRDLAASRLVLINKAVTLAAAEGANPVAQSAEAVERALLADGLSPAQARALAAERIFGGVDGNYGTGIMDMVENGASWQEAGEIGRQYLVNMNARYGSSDDWGANTPGLFATVLQGTEAIVQPRESNTTGPLALDHVYEFMGGISQAVTAVTGGDPDAYFNDFRTPGDASVTDLESAIAEELHATLLNPKYIEALTTGGASSAAVFAEIFRNTHGWEAMRPTAIGDAVWNELFAVYVEDREGLHIRDFFERVHPQSLQEMTAVMLETARKGLWDASDKQLGALTALHAELIEAHGAGCSGFVCGNAELRRFIGETLPAPAAESYQAALNAALTDPQAGTALVLTEQDRTSPEPTRADAEVSEQARSTPEKETAITPAIAVAGVAGLLIASLGLLAARARRHRVT